MPWIKEVCEDAICATGLGIVKGLFGVSVYTSDEVKEAANLQQLVASVLSKSPEFVTDSVICDSIKMGQTTGLESFAKTAPPEIVDAGVVAAATVVCNKAFKERFKAILMGACLNLVGCSK
jgi:hypothetical protein